MVRLHGYGLEHSNVGHTQVIAASGTSQVLSVGHNSMSVVPKKYPKRRIAEIQIYRAIKLLTEDADAISAITLAGAAEEILGQKLRDLGKRRAFDHQVDYGRQMWELAAKEMKKKGRTLSVPNDEELKRRANRIRNELKHKGGDRPLFAYFDCEAEEMIIRALNNYLLLYQSPPPQKCVQNWYENQTL